MSDKVDAFLAKAKTWRAEYEALRRILRDAPLTETLKWGTPCYALDGKNVVLMHGFKAYCALLFFKGALLDDPHGLLVAQTTSTQAQRQLRFASVAEVDAREPIIRAYVHEALEKERAGLQVAFKATSEFAVPAELQAALDEDAALRDAFDALTPGRQRAYLLHFAGAKRAATREARIARWRPHILAGRGLDDEA